MKNDETAYLLLRLSGGAVMLLMSIWKVVVTDYWIQTYMPVQSMWPFGPRIVLYSTAVLGVILAGLLLLGWHVSEAALVSALLLFATMGLLVVTMREVIVEPFIRDIGLLGVYIATYFMATKRESDPMIEMNYNGDSVTIDNLAE